MDKIFNNPKVNVYGGRGMINKYIYMKRNYNDYIVYFIYQIIDVIKENFPTTYSCKKIYSLTVYKNGKTKASVNDNLVELKLENNDELYEININEYIAIFKLFIDCEGTYISKLSEPLL